MGPSLLTLLPIRLLLLLFANCHVTYPFYIIVQHLQENDPSINCAHLLRGLDTDFLGHPSILQDGGVCVYKGVQPIDLINLVDANYYYQLIVGEPISIKSQ